MASERRRDLIDRNRLLRDPYFREDRYPESNLLRMAVKEQPTIDAVEVVHGEWVVCGDGEYVPFMCSACGKTTSWYHAQTANYCPNCGARMDGERKENHDVL